MAKADVVGNISVDVFEQSILQSLQMWAAVEGC